MGTQFQCNGCGTVTEPVAGLCPICDSPMTTEVAPAQSTSGVEAPPQVPPVSDSPPPAARPDPYSQFGNPLHDTWGQHQPVEPVLASPPQRVHTARRKRPWLNRILVIVVLVALAGAAWIKRSWLDEQWDSIYETVEEWTGDDVTPRDTTGSETLFEEMDLSGVERVDYRDTPENRDFLKWERTHSEQLDTVGENLMVALSVKPDENTGRTEAADTSGAAATRAREVLELVDTAPDSQLRTAAVTMFMQMFHTFGLIERTIRERSPALAQETDAAVRELGVTMTAYSGFADKSIIFSS